MFVTRVKLKNWRNFLTSEIRLRERVFVVGSNAAGKSNFLDIFRFLRDIAKKQGGGFQEAVACRGGLSKIRCLSARNVPYVEIEIDLDDDPDSSVPRWRYSITLEQEPRGKRRVLLKEEKVWHLGKLIVNRPDESDLEDGERLTLTFLESSTTNANFRPIADFFGSVSYLHLVPQLLRSVESSVLERDGDDFYGKNFLVKIANTPEKTRNARLKKIIEALQHAVPQFEEIREERDIAGAPHLAMRLKHWRPNAGWQREDQFSDGTIRMIGLFWALLESDSLLLFEEPELSLNDRVVAQLPALIWKLQASRGRQVILSTHSYSLLNDRGIAPEEVILLAPSKEGSEIRAASDDPLVAKLVEEGMGVGEAILPLTDPTNAHEIAL